MRGSYRSRLTAAGLVLGLAGAAWAVVGGGEVVIKIDGMPNVLFSHEDHVNTAQQKCTDCHYSIFTTRSKHRTVTMAQMRAGQSCGSCHNGQRAFTVDNNRFCGKCHRK